MRDTMATVRLTRHCPTCGIAIQIESMFNLKIDNEQMIGFIVKKQLDSLDANCPSKCPKCSKKDWAGKEVIYIGP